MTDKKTSRYNMPPEYMSIHMLIGEISRITKNAVRRESEAVGLPQGFRAIIFHLSRRDGITQLELARLTNLKPPTISVSLQKMEQEGLVSRKNDSADLRKTIVTLTDKGRSIISRLDDVFLAYDKAITDSLTKEEAKTLKALLLKARAGVISKMEEHTGK